MKKEDIYRFNEKARESDKGKFMYWKVSKPTSTMLTLNNAIRHTNTLYKKDPKLFEANPWLYFPELRMVGHLDEITTTLEDAGIKSIKVSELYNLGKEYGIDLGHKGPLHVNKIKLACINPIDPACDELLQMFNLDHKNVVKSKIDDQLFDRLIKIGRVLKDNKGISENRVKVEASKRPPSKNTTLRSKALQVENFDKLLNDIKENGSTDKWIDVSKFSPDTYSGARKRQPLNNVEKSGKVFPYLNDVPIYVICDNDKIDILKEYLNLIGRVNNSKDVDLMLPTIKDKGNKVVNNLLDNLENLLEGTTDKWIDVSKYNDETHTGVRNVVPIKLEKSNKIYGSYNNEIIFIISNNEEAYYNYVDNIVSINHPEMVDELKETLGTVVAN